MLALWVLWFLVFFQLFVTRDHLASTMDETKPLIKSVSETAPKSSLWGSLCVPGFEYVSWLACKKNCHCQFANQFEEKAKHISSNLLSPFGAQNKDIGAALLKILTRVRLHLWRTLGITQPVSSGSAKFWKMRLQASKGFPDMAADEHCPYAATVYNALTGSKLPVNVICCSQRDREIFLSKLVVSWQILFNYGEWN